RLARVLQQPAHHLPAGDPVRLLGWVEGYAGRAELVADAAARVPALREDGVIRDAVGPHLPRRAELSDALGQHRHGVAHALGDAAGLVGRELVHQHERAARVEALRSDAEWDS